MIPNPAPPIEARVTRYCAAWVLPVTGPAVADGAVLVRDGRIAAVGPRADVAITDDVQEVDLGNVILMPGMINVHAHPELSVLRGAIEDLPFHEWIFRLRRIKAAVGFTADDWRDAARWTCIEAIASGITTLGATEDSDAALHAMRDCGMRGITFREVFAPSPADAGTAMQTLAKNIEQMCALQTDLVRVGISPHAPYSVCDQLFEAAATFARTQLLPVAVHASESDSEQHLVTMGTGAFADGLQRRGIGTPIRGRSTIDMLHRTGILDLAPLLIHCVRADAEDIRMLYATASRVAHCPVANARLGHGIAPVTEMIDAGVTVGIGSDSVASNNRIDMLEEARIAQMMQRARHLSPTLLPAAQLLRMITIDGARALGIDGRVGSIEVGKDADLCAIAIDGAHTQPLYEPVSALFMSARGSDAVMTMVRGDILYWHGRHLRTDTEDLGERIAALGSTVRSNG